MLSQVRVIFCHIVAILSLNLSGSNQIQQPSERSLAAIDKAFANDNLVFFDSPIDEESALSYSLKEPLPENKIIIQKLDRRIFADFKTYEYFIQKAFEQAPISGFYLEIYDDDESSETPFWAKSFHIALLAWGLTNEALKEIGDEDVASKIFARDFISERKDSIRDAILSILEITGDQLELMIGGMRQVQGQTPKVQKELCQILVAEGLKRADEVRSMIDDFFNEKTPPATTFQLIDNRLQEIFSRRFDPNQILNCNFFIQNKKASCQNKARVLQAVHRAEVVRGLKLKVLNRQIYKASIIEQQKKQEQKDRLELARLWLSSNPDPSELKRFFEVLDTGGKIEFLQNWQTDLATQVAAEFDKVSSPRAEKKKKTVKKRVIRKEIIGK